jgi:dUTP pyrophosphatase
MLKVKLLHPEARLPTVAHPGEDLAYDIYALEDAALEPGTVARVRTGVALAAYDLEAGRPLRLGLLVKDRSSMAAKGVFTHGGVIDAGYTGEVGVLMSSLRPYAIAAGDRIAQLVPVRVRTGGAIEAVEELTGVRGEAGFGSTGR